jgi:glycosyltransferase involved in cell wall biosynthesis
MHVQILMGTYNGERWIGAQLDSLLCQTHQDWSLWISDDGSQDSTREILADFTARHPDRVVRFLEGPRQGSTANYLHLLCHPDLQAGYVALADQDDVWLPNKLERALGKLQAAGPDPCVWAARYMLCDADLTPLKASGGQRLGPSFSNALVQNVLSGHTLTLNPAAVALLRSVGKVPVPHHDWWIYLAIMAAQGQAILDNEVVLLYRQHSANTVGARQMRHARLKRFIGLMRGQLGEWIDQNLSALVGSSLELQPDAKALLQAWPKAGSLSCNLRRAHLLYRCGAHRQSRAETALMYLAALAGRMS